MTFSWTVLRFHPLTFGAHDNLCYLRDRVDNILFSKVAMLQSPRVKELLHPRDIMRTSNVSQKISGVQFDEIRFLGTCN